MANASNTVIFLDEIVSKPIVRQGVRHAGRSEKGARAIITPGKSIRLVGTRWPNSPLATAYDRTFAVGDAAEYHAYNYSYIGRVTSITEKTVTIIDDDRRAHRLEIYDFDCRNWKFDLAKAVARNAVESECV